MRSGAAVKAVEKREVSRRERGPSILRKLCRVLHLNRRGLEALTGKPITTRKNWFKEIYFSRLHVPPGFASWCDRCWSQWRTDGSVAAKASFSPTLPSRFGNSGRSGRPLCEWGGEVVFLPRTDRSSARPPPPARNPVVTARVPVPIPIPISIVHNRSKAIQENVNTTFFIFLHILNHLGHSFFVQNGPQGLISCSADTQSNPCQSPGVIVMRYRQQKICWLTGSTQLFRSGAAVITCTRARQAKVSIWCVIDRIMMISAEERWWSRQVAALICTVYGCKPWTFRVTYVPRVQWSNSYASKKPTVVTCNFPLMLRWSSGLPEEQTPQGKMPSVNR